MSTRRPSTLSLATGAALVLVGIAGCSRPPAPTADRSPIGKWSPLAARDAVSVEALPYARGYRPPIGPSSEVVVHDPARARGGLNLLTSGQAAQAELIDMAGRERHRWAKPIAEAFPELRGNATAVELDYFRRVHLLPDGSLLGIYEGQGLVKLDRASRILWARRGNFHHDLLVAADGTIWVLDRQGRVLPRIHPAAGVLEDFITHLSPDGAVLERISVLEAFEQSEFHDLLAEMPRQGDILHTNTLELLDGRAPGAPAAFRAGNLLVSVLTTSTLAVIDPQTRSVVWALRGAWRKQHQPTLLDSGRILLFDNTGIDRDHSRVLEIEPRDGAIVWQYGGRDGEALASRTLGSAQRLANGNTLITESERGRAIEVAPGGRIVWEYRSPYRTRVGSEELVAALLEGDSLARRRAGVLTPPVRRTRSPAARRSRGSG